MNWFSRVFFKKGGSPETVSPVQTAPMLPNASIADDDVSRLEEDRRILDAHGGSYHENRVQREVEREVRSAAEISLKRLHVIQRGRCPKCGERIRQHLTTAVCDSCGWFSFDAPRKGPVRVHLKNADPIQGDRIYVVESGDVLVLRNDVVLARVPAASVVWLEYEWSESEILDRRRQLFERMNVLCGWCNRVADPESEGFHLVQAAFGATQERYCFCSDPCYEAFRKMYPARVHRDCYERACATCDLCIKRYDDEASGLLTLPKDLLNIKRK